MTITIPKPTIKIPALGKLPKLPPAAVIGLLIFEALALGPKTSKPSCTLTVQRPHYSTYQNEYKDSDDVKVNIKSLCSQRQKNTQIGVQIYSLTLNGLEMIHDFGNVRAFADPKNSYAAYFEFLFVPCNKETHARYKAIAKGSVKLVSGEEISVASDSGNPVDVPCKIGAE